MKVLSIDLDYCMSDECDYYESDFDSDNPFAKWDVWSKETGRDDGEIPINPARVLECLDIFKEALKYCDDVDFGYEHDAILYRLQDETDIEIINYDHHSDVLNGGGFEGVTQEYEYETLKIFDNVCEGNWVGWLDAKNKLRKYTWINYREEGYDSLEEFEGFRRELLGDRYENLYCENFKIDDYKFDYIFVCLSPSYIPTSHWKYFKIFMNEYKFTKKKLPNIINRKFEIDSRYKLLNKYFVECNLTCKN